MAALIVVFCVFLTYRKIPVAQGRHTLKCVFMNLKLQTLPPPINPVMI